jgi:hypothetical protein
MEEDVVVGLSSPEHVVARQDLEVGVGESQTVGKLA